MKIIRTYLSKETLPKFADRFGLYLRIEQVKVDSYQAFLSLPGKEYNAVYASGKDKWACGDGSTQSFAVAELCSNLSNDVLLLGDPDCPHKVINAQIITMEGVTLPE